MNKGFPFLALLATVLVAGCTLLEPLPTPSGKPEVVIGTTDVGRVKDAFVQTFHSMGFALLQDGTYSFVFTKTMQGKELFGYRLAAGSSFTSVPQINVALSITPLPAATQVIAHQTLVTRGAFGPARVGNGDRGERARDLQKVLENVKADMEEAVRKRKHS